MTSISPTKLAELRKRLALQNAISSSSPNNPEASAEGSIPSKTTSTNSISTQVSNVVDLHIPSRSANEVGIDRSTGKVIEYNSQQQEFINLMASGESAVLIGAAGSGKTTCQRGGISALIASGKVGTLDAQGHKYLRSNTPGIVICAYTRRAVANIRKAVSDDMKHNCITIHKLLEYQPVEISVLDEETGLYRTSKPFLPTRNAENPLPASIHTVVIEEASMVSVELFRELCDAFGDRISQVQFIFLGDIQQLPPVFGSAILGYKMLELPVIELIQIYRQALESPIIQLAHRILSGKEIPRSEFPDWKIAGKLTLHDWKKELSADNALLTLAKFLTVAIDAGAYDPEEDMVALPFNKGCGTIELNKHIAQHMTRKRGNLVYEVIAGWEKLYLAPGDKVLVDKEDGVILSIEKNPAYTGAEPQPAHTRLDYWGYNDETGGDSQHHISNTDGVDADIDFMLSMAVSSGEEAKKQASHIVKVKLLETEREIELKSAGDLNGMLHSYALTVHKLQGSEYRKLFLLLHKSHNTMLNRELLYTACTRAKEELYVICEPDSFVKGIKTQKIKGNTLAEKAEFFKGKVNRQGGI